MATASTTPLTSGARPAPGLIDEDLLNQEVHQAPVKAGRAATPAGKAAPHPQADAQAADAAAPAAPDGQPAEGSGALDPMQANDGGTPPPFLPSMTPDEAAAAVAQALADGRDISTELEATAAGFGGAGGAEEGQHSFIRLDRVTEGTTGVGFDFPTSETPLPDTGGRVLVDDQPTAIDDNATVAEDSGSLSGNVLGNDLVGNDGPAALVNWTGNGASYGTFTPGAGGSWTYLLDNSLPAIQGLDDGETLTETFTYTMRDADGDTDSATLTVTITGVNDAPTLTIDTGNEGNADDLVHEAGLPQGSDPSADSEIATGQIVLADVDGLDDLQSVTINGTTVALADLAGSSIAGDHGTLLITGYSGGVISYEYTLSGPTTDGEGPETDSFTVTVSDGSASSAPATLTIGIVDDLPTAVDDSNGIASENAVTLNGNVLENDVQGADGASITAGTFTGTYGTLVLAADGSYTYTLDSSDPDFIALPGGSNATETFSYTLTDGDSDTDTGLLTLSIRNDDDGVVITDLTPKGEGGDAMVDEDDLADGSDTSKESLTTSGDFSISAPDGVASLSIGGHAVITDGVFTATSFTTADGNTLSITGYDSGSGVVSYSYTLADNEAHDSGNGQNSLFEDFAVALTDSDGDTTSGTLSVNIVDDVPTAVDDSNGTASENLVQLLGNVMANDVQGADGATVTAGTFTGTYGSLTLAADGSYTYTLDPADPDFTALVGDQSASDSFTYTLTDGDGDVTTATLTIGLQNADDGVVILDLTPSSEGGDAMVDEDDLADGSDTSKESLTATGTFGLLAPDGVDSLTVGGHAVITDGVFTATSFTTADGNTLSITGYDSGTGVVSYSYTLADNEAHDSGNGQNSLFEDFAVVLTDRDGDSTSGTLSVNIVDDVPTAVADSNGTANESNLELTGNVLLNDVQGADGAAVTAATLTGTYGSLALAADGSYTYTLDTGDADFLALVGGASASDTFTYTLTDADGDSSTATLTLAVGNDDDGVLITNLTPKGEGGDAMVDEDDLSDGSDTSKESLTTTGNFSVSAPDGIADLSIGGHSVITDGVFTATSFTTADGNTLSITGYDSGTGVVSYSYTLADNEAHDSGNGQNSLFEDFAVSLTDSDGDTTSGTLSINIVDDVPTAVADSNGTANENAVTLIGNVMGNDVQGADGASVTAATLTGTYGTLVLAADGGYTYTLNPADPDFVALVGGQTASDTFSYTLTDADGDSSTANLTIGVQNADDGVLITNLTPSGEGGDASVDEDDLARGTDASKESTTTSGDFSISAPDGVDDLSIGGHAVITDGVFAATSFTTALGNTLSITGYDSGTGVISYSYTLNVSEDHGSGGGENTLYEDFTVLLSDRDGDSASDTLSIRIIDDVPLAFTPEAGYISNSDGASFTGSLDADGNLDDNTGADQPGTVRFDSAIAGDSGLTSLGQSVYYYLSSDGQTLTASTSTTEAGVDSGNTVFTVALNPDGDYSLANDTYTVTMSGTLDNGSGTSFENLTGTGPAGNPDFKIVESDPSNPEALEILFTPAGGATSVNSDSDDVGVSSQFIVAGEGLRVDFGQFSITPADNFTIDSHTAINGFTFGINQIAGGSTASALLKAYDANGDSNFSNDTLDTITRILVYSLAGVLLADSSVGNSNGVSFTEHVDGTWTVTGLHADYNITTLTADGYDRIEVYNADVNATDGKFSMSNLSVLVTDTGVPVSQDLGLVLTDNDGDTSSGTLSVTFEPSALDGNDTVNGTIGIDTLYGGAGNDTLDGKAGNDVLDGGSGNDTLIGGKGNDTLTGGSGADTFVWHLGDGGSAGSPAVDTVTDFHIAEGDVLDLRDLLAGESTATLTQYLHFEHSGADTIVDVSSTGAFNGSNYATAVDQRIVLANVDLAGASDTDIINNLLASTSLRTDT